ncbi:exopolysaccharide biosynthesis polyprenyl glycosylphosphotransferase [Rubrivirga sp.]|uniref:exopolysaccharide biosynthesis polyprenyl glycosylphosphotransferase n=1 Tax=Rubrivirga sp. TaxID=1885344 RepID=UPI003B52F5CC
METVALSPDRPFSRQRELARAYTSDHTKRRALNAASLAAAEVAALAVALLAAGLVRQVVMGEAGAELGFGWAVVPLYLGVSVLAGLLPGWGLGAVEELRRVVLVVAGVFGLTVVGLWLASGPDGAVASRLAISAAGALAVVLLPMARWSAKAALVRRDGWGVPAVVYGAGPAGARVVRQLQEERGIGYTPVAVFSDDVDVWGGFLDAIPIVGDTTRVAPEAAVAFLALPESRRDRQIDLLEGPLSCYATVVVIPDLFEAPSLWVTPRDIAGVLGLELRSTLTHRAPQFVKRSADLVVALALAPLWAPVVGLLALWVWLADGASPFYAQERVGLDGAPFRAWKLRTMVPDAEAVLRAALDADPALRAEWDEHFKLERDPRITAPGRLLRRTSLDELPQIVNVLRGEMSFVGPRPLPAYHHGELSERVRALRERVRPGITGLWQVSGRSDAGNLGMERWDPYYVRNWSPWLDAVILVRTVRVVMQGSGAY